MAKRIPPRQHLRRTMRFARRAARWHGHALGPWRGTSPLRRAAECEKCGAVAFIAGDPAKLHSELELIGDALSQRCKFIT
jgi:hypothetical protein